MKIKSEAISGWKYVLIVCLGLVVLAAIAGVVVISLITVYLKTKTVDLSMDSTNNATNTVNMVFATDFRDGSTYSISDFTSLSDQLNQYLNAPSYKLVVDTASFIPSTITTVADGKKRKKRETGGEISCDSAVIGTNQDSKYGDKIVLKTYMDKGRTGLCPKSGCNAQQLTTIKSKIFSKLNPNTFSFSIKLNDGSVITIKNKFCSFGTGSYMSPKPRALVSVDTKSVVGILFDEIPQDARTMAKNLLDQKDDEYWQKLATEQMQNTQVKLIFRPSYYEDIQSPSKRGTLSLTLPEFFDITLTTQPYFTTIDGHLLYVRNYTFHNILITNVPSIAETDDRLAVVGGSMIETFNLPVDPFLVLQRTEFACMGESQWPPLSIDPETTEFFYDDTCEVEEPQDPSLIGCQQCHCSYPLPTLSCIDALKQKIGLVTIDLNFTRIPDDPELARQWRFPADGPSVNVLGEVAPVNLFELEGTLALRRFVYLYIEPTGCEIAEKCVGGSGWRRLMLFSTTSPNYGINDFNVGAVSYFVTQLPSELVTKRRIYEYSPCHKHFHFTHYAQFEFGKQNPISNTKRGFCLQTTYRHANAEWAVMAQDHYLCSNQGISPGWSDTYQSGIRCQWVDVSTINTSISTHMDEFNSILNPDGFLCEGNPINDTWLSTNFTTLCCNGSTCCGDTPLTECCGGLPVQKPACNTWSDADKDNKLTAEITVPLDGEGQVTEDCRVTSGKWGEKRDCGFRLHPKGKMLTCSTPGQNATLKNVTATTFFQVVRICEASLVLNSCLSCIWNSSLTSQIITQGISQDINFTCTPQRDSQEIGGKFCIYVAPLFEEMDHDTNFVQWSSVQ